MSQSPDTYIFEARHGWIVRAALQGAQDMIAKRPAMPTWTDDNVDGQLTVTVAVAVRLVPARDVA